MPSKSKKQSKQSSKSSKIEPIFKPRPIKIKAIGLGGGGSAIVSEMAKSLKGVSFMVADTDQRTFKKVPKGVKTFQFGEDLTRGLGTGMDPELGLRAALPTKEKIEKIFKAGDFIILVSSLGGGVGSGAAPFFAKIASDQKNITLGIFTLPFDFEGEKKMRIAKNSLSELRENLSGTVSLSNETIFRFCDKRTPLKKALSLLNQALIEYLNGLIEMILAPGVINIDFADLKTILAGRGRTIYFGQGQGQGPNRGEEAIKQIFQNPFFGSPPKFKRILFNISGDKDLGLREVEQVSRAISELSPKAKIIFGISQNAIYAKKVKITLLGVGESLREAEGKREPEKEKKKPEIAKAKRDKLKKKSPTKASVERRGILSKESVPSEGKEKKAKIRRTGLEIKKAQELAEEEELAQETEWELPAFFRKKTE